MFVINGQQLNCYNFPSCNVYYWVGEDTFIIHLSFTVVVKHRYDSLRVYKSTSFISTAIQVAEEAFIELENICHGSESLWRLNTLTGFVLLSGRLMSNSSTCVLLRALTCRSFISLLVIHNHFKSFFKNRVEILMFFVFFKIFEFLLKFHCL